MMRHSAPRTGARLLGMIVCLAGPVAAQRKAPPPPPKPPLGVEVDVGVGYVTANIDRGLVLSNLPQLTPHLRVSVKPGPGHARVILGLTGFAELITPRDSSKFGLAADSLKRPNLVEARPSLTFVQGFGKKGDVAVDVGFTYRIFPNVAGATKLNNTGMFRVGVGAPNLPIPLRVGALYETGAIEGPSLEATLGGDFRFSPNAAAILRADAGYAVDTKASPGISPRIARLARNGFTHLDLTTGLDLTIAGAGVRPFVTATYAADTAAMLVPITGTPRRWLGRFGVSLAIRKSTIKPAPPPPPAKVAPKPAATGAKPAPKKP